MNIKIKFAALATAAWALSSFGDASISQVAVRQQWPWSTKINVDFTLANETGGAVDVTVAATNGNAEVVLPDAALSGNRIGLSSSGNYRIVIDPAKLSLGTATVLGDFKVSLSVAPSRADYDEVLYRIYALDDSTPAREDVTVADLLNGKYGDYETDYSFARDGEWNPGEVLIWTGVTNNPAYKTTHLVMRRCNAGSFNMLPNTTDGNIPVTISNPFYIGVFEMTYAQCENLASGRAKMFFTNAVDRAMRPMDGCSFINICGNSALVYPESYEQGPGTYIGRLRTETGNSTFNLPTEAMWEYAARAGVETIWNNGGTDTRGQASNTVAPKLGRTKFTGGYVNGSVSPDLDCGATNGTAIVGSYLPNAWGLYDCHGNVAEWCMDRYSAVTELTGGIDPKGSTSASMGNRVVRGNYWGVGATSQYIDARAKADKERDYASTNAPEEGGFGFRVICGVGE